LALGDGWGNLEEIYAEVLNRADLALAVGFRFDVITDARYGARFPRRLVQVDLDPRVIGQRRTAEVGIVGDAAFVLESLSAGLAASESGGCWLNVDEVRRRRRELLSERAGPVFTIWQDLRAGLPRDAIVVDDLTCVGYWAPLLFETYRPRTLLHAGTFGTLGYALPAAIGAKIACPEQAVLAIVGDGGFLYTVQELATARAENLDLVILLFNDNAFGALKTYQDRFFGGRQIGSDLLNPDFLKLADAFDLKSARVEPGEIGAAVTRAIAEGGIWLIEVPFEPRGSAAIVPWMA
jgi:acetolactate synthase-1/2/3 large subunit